MRIFLDQFLLEISILSGHAVAGLICIKLAMKGSMEQLKSKAVDSHSGNCYCDSSNSSDIDRAS